MQLLCLLHAGLILLCAYSVSGQSYVCSETPLKLTTNSGNVDVVLPANTSCQLQVNISSKDSSKQVHLVVQPFSLQPGDTSKFYSTADDKSLVVEKRGSTVGFVVVLPAQESRILLSSLTRITGPNSTFSISYDTTECQMKVGGAGAEIQTPYYAENLPQPLVNCTYTVTGPNDANAQVWSFKQVDLVKGNIVFKDGDTTLATFTDGMKHSADLVASNTVTVQIQLATSKQQLGFIASYVSLSNAPIVLNLTSETVVSSPGYPYGYLGNQELRWQLLPPAGWALQVTVNDLDLAGADDLLLFVDGDSLYDRQMALYSNPKDVAKGTFLLSSGGHVWMQFKSGAEQQTSSGFNVTLSPQYFSRAVLVEDKPVQVVLETSPNMTDVPMDQLVILQMAAPADKRVRVEFNDSVLYPTTTVKCYNGWDLTVLTTQEPLAIFRSDLLFYPVVADSNLMLVTVEGFYDNGTAVQQRLTANVMLHNAQENYQILTGSQGRLIYESKQPPAGATWLIQNEDPSKEVSLYIKQLLLPPGVCVLIYQGLSSSSFMIANLTSNAQTPYPIIKATTMRVEVVDKDGSNNTMNGEDISTLFDAQYSVDNNCRSNSMSGLSQGSVVTPLFPNLYPYNLLCVWNVSYHEPSASVVHLSFVQFQVYSEHQFKIEGSESYNVTHGNQTVIDVNTTSLLTASGDAIPDDLIVSSDYSLTFTFSSLFNGNLDDLHVGQGVKVNYKYLSCGSTLETNDGKVQTPGYPAVLKDSLECVWIIRVPVAPRSDNTSVNTILFTLHQGANKKDTLENVIIRDGGSARAPLVAGNLTTKVETMSRTNVLWVQYVFNSVSNTTGAPFSLSFKTYSCPVSQQCKNAICMHPEWRCDGYDQCGDHSDEDNCTYASNKSGVSYTILAVSVVLAVLLGVVLAVAVPMIYRRLRFHNYSELRDFMTPVPT